MNTMKYFVTVYPQFLLPITGFVIGWYMDRHENLRLSKFRDKSALYGRELAPGEPPSWP